MQSSTAHGKGSELESVSLPAMEPNDMNKRDLNSQRTPIRKAVEPLKIVSQDDAEAWTRKQIAKATEQLAAANWNREQVAAYPRSTSVSRADYTHAVRRYHFFKTITTARQSTRSMHEPCFCDLNPEGVEKMVRDAREVAGIKYEAFIDKLEKKVGAHTSAALEGNHIWGWSFLTVETPAGKQIWKTRQITNVSVLGTYFPQWPSRKVKAVDL